MEQHYEFLVFLDQYELWGNSARAYLEAVLWLVGTIIFLKIFERIIVRKLRRLAKKTRTDIDDVIIETIDNVGLQFYFVIALYLAIRSISFPGHIMVIINAMFLIVLMYEIIKIIQRLFSFSLKSYERNQDAAGEPVNPSLIAVSKLMVTIAVWSVGLLLVLSNLGVNVTSLVASLGIGGIAIALAVQNILGDLFSSFTLFVDKPFQVGDFIVIGNDSGTVEKIGLKSSRMRTLRGEELVVSNKELTSIRIQNLKTLKRRRVAFDIVVLSNTPGKKLEELPGAIEEIISQISGLHFDRCHLSHLTENGISFEVVYHIETDEYQAHMDTKQEMYLALLAYLRKEKIGLAYQTITLEKA